MMLVYLILLVMGIWWLALAIVMAVDKSKKSKLPAEVAKPKPDDSRALQPRWPSWNEYRADPALFFIIPWCALIYGVAIVFIWPAILIHKIWTVEG